MEKLFSQIIAYSSKLISKHQKSSSFEIETFDQANALQKAFADIQSEFISFRSNHSHLIQPIEQISKAQKSLTDHQPGGWRTLFLKAYGYENMEVISHFPVTNKILNQSKSTVSVFFSNLEPGMSLPAHTGKYNGLLRLQFGISIPEPNKTSLTVECRVFQLKESEVLIFDDTFIHAAENNSQFSRVVLIIDFLRPLPFYLHIINKIGIWAIKRSSYVKDSMSKLNQTPKKW